MRALDLFGGPRPRRLPVSSYRFPVGGHKVRHRRAINTDKPSATNRAPTKAVQIKSMPMPVRARDPAAGEADVAEEDGVDDEAVPVLPVPCEFVVTGDAAAGLVEPADGVGVVGGLVPDEGRTTTTKKLVTSFPVTWPGEVSPTKVYKGAPL
jgi:hypothetical protein